MTKEVMTKKKEGTIKKRVAMTRRKAVMTRRRRKAVKKKVVKTRMTMSQKT
jgi:hypothetical protein